jgi:glucokinase
LIEVVNEQILVFDVGGSHIAGGVFNPAGMALSTPKTFLVPNSGSAAEIFGTFEALSKLLGVNPPSLIGVGVALPNPFDYERGVSYMKHKYQQLYGLDVRLGLSKTLACDPAQIHFLNDAAAFLIGELYQGAAGGVSRAVGITLGTGIGSAFGVEGQIVVDGPGVPPNGEIWNFPYGGGTVEDAVSTRAIQRLYQEQTGQRKDVREIARLSPEQPAARETFASFGRELGKALRLTCAPFAPERIVLGGGISRAVSLFLPAAEAELVDLSISLRVSELDDCAPLIGAGVDWMQKHMPGPAHQNREQSVAEGR